MSEFEGRTAVITGASRGIGRDIALGLGAAGANVVVNYVASGEAAAAVADEIGAAGGAALACRADISQSADVARLMAAALDAFGAIDILVNNAGINADGPLLTLGEADWDAVVDVNLKGAFLCTQAAGRAMTAAGRGHIVNISAFTGIDARAGAANYCVSKAGLNMLTKCAALELAPDVRVNGLALGFIRSELVEDVFSAERIAAVVDQTPLARLGEFEEVTAAVKFLASDASSFITGQTIVIDGGRIMR